MKKQTELIAVRILIAIFALFAIRATFIIINSRIKVRQLTRQKMQEMKAPGLSRKDSILADKQSILDYGEGLKWRRDPFGATTALGAAPGVSSTTSSDKRKGALNLDGIIWDEVNPLAIINGAVVKKGSFIDNAQVLEINRNNVTIKQEGKEEKIFLKK